MIYVGSIELDILSKRREKCTKRIKKRAIAKLLTAF